MKVPFRSLRYAFGESFLNLAEATASRLPLWAIRLAMDSLFCLLYPVVLMTPSFRKTVMKNLEIAFGDTLTRREIRRIARASMRNTFRMPGDILFYGSPKNLDRLKRDVTIRGMEHITEALDKGKGVVGLGAHMTGFLLLTVRLSHAGVPFVVPIKDPRNGMLRNKLRGWRALSGVRSIDVDSPDRGKRKIGNCLVNNEVVYLIADERKKRDGIMVPFFGKEALTPVGPAVFSLRTDAPIVPIFIARRDGRLFIDIFPPLDGAGGGERHSVSELTALANRAIEDYIRAYPEQWIWAHQRWRV